MQCVSLRRLTLWLCFLLLGLSALPAKAQLYQLGESDIPPIPHTDKLISAGGISDIYLLALAPEKLLGVASRAAYNALPAYFPQSQHLPFIGRIAGRASGLPAEKIIQLKPDLIIDADNGNPGAAERISRQTQIPYVLLNANLAQIPIQLRQLGRLLQREDRAQQLADFAEKSLAQTHNIAADSPLRRIYFGRGADGLETGGSESVHSEVLNWVGAVNVAEQAGKLVGRVSLEQLLMWDPEIILTSDRHFYAALKQDDSLWQALSAVKAQRVYLVPSQPFGWLDQPPSLNRLAGALWLSSLLAPDKLARDTARTAIRDYFQRFFRYTVTEEDWLNWGL